MTREDVEVYAEAIGQSLVCFPEFDECIVGVGRRFTDTFVIYDYDMVIEVLMARDGMTFEDAVEWVETNTMGGWHGETTPCFLSRTL